MLDDVRLHADDVAVGNDKVGGGKMLNDDAQFVKLAALDHTKHTNHTSPYIYKYVFVSRYAH